MYQLSLTFQLSQDGSVKPLGINRLEMSQFLSNAPLGQSHLVNLKILKCSHDSDAFVSIAITIMEQVSDRMTDDSFKSESSSMFSRSETHSNIGIQDSQNPNSSMKVLAQSRSEKNFTEMKFKKNSIRLVSQQQNLSKDSHSQSPDNQSKEVVKVINKNNQFKTSNQNFNISNSSISINNNNIIATGPQSLGANQQPNRIDSLIKQLQNDERDEKIKQQAEQINTLTKQVDNLSQENQGLRSIKEQQEVLIAHLKSQTQGNDSNNSSTNCTIELENQNLKKNLVDIQGKYQHLLTIIREQHVGQKSTPQQSKKQNLKSVNTTEEDDYDQQNVKQTSENYVDEMKQQHNVLFDSIEEFKNMPSQFTLKDKYNYLKVKLNSLLSEKSQIESQLINAKMSWATIELDRDNLMIKLNTQQEKINQITNENLQMQSNLVKTKQELGEALNQAYEHERVNRNLLEKYGGENSEICGMGADQQQPKQSLGSEKPEKKTSRIKKFFKKQ